MHMCIETVSPCIWCVSKTRLRITDCHGVGEHIDVAASPPATTHTTTQPSHSPVDKELIRGFNRLANAGKIQLGREEVVQAKGVGRPMEQRVINGIDDINAGFT